VNGSATGNAFIAASPDGARVVLSREVRSVEDGALVCRLALEGHYPGSVAFTAGGDRVVSGGLEKRIAVFDARTGAVTATMDRCGQVWSIDASPDGSMIASGAETPRARLWSVDGEARKDLAATGTPLVWDGIRGPHCAGAKESGRKVEHLRFIDERRIAVAFNDGRVCIHDGRTRRPLVTLGMFDGGRWVALAPDGAWDGSDGLDRVQWAWSTDQRTYRDVVTLDPARRRAGLLAEACARD
jgi:WD40 repeat protein